MKKFARSFPSDFRNKRDSIAVKNGATEMITPTLDAIVYVSAIFSNRQYKHIPHNYFNQFIGLAPGTYREIFSEKDGDGGQHGE